MKRFTATFAIVLSLAAVPSTAGAAANGGAANMVNSHAIGGMSNAMTVNSPNGDQGMWCAVDVTNGMPTPVGPGSCPE